MNLKTKEITLNKKPLIISEASNDINLFVFPDVEEWAKKQADGDEILEFFATNIYSSLASCTSPMPALKEAYKLKPEKIDEWYAGVREINPSWFDALEFTEECLEFSDGTKITVQSNRPSVLMKRLELEDKAAKETALEDTGQELFRRYLYAKLAGCSKGQVPDVGTAMLMNPEDKQLWYYAGLRQIPDWFLSTEQMTAQNKAGAKAEKKSE